MYMYIYISHLGSKDKGLQSGFLLKMLPSSLSLERFGLGIQK